jgi:hypothetical protein
MELIALSVYRSGAGVATKDAGESIPAGEKYKSVKSILNA